MTDKKLYNRKIKLQELRDVIKIQCSEGNWNVDPYMQGMANGLILALSVVTDKIEEITPGFLQPPVVWLNHKPQKEKVLTKC